MTASRRRPSPSDRSWIAVESVSYDLMSGFEMTDGIGSSNWRSPLRYVSYVQPPQTPIFLPSRSLASVIVVLSLWTANPAGV